MRPPTSLTQPVTFWIATLAALVAVIVLLRDTLLPLLPRWCSHICSTLWLPERGGLE